MEHLFEIPVEYKGEELNLNGRVSVLGYVYKIYIVINEEEFVFEKDDDGKYRVLVEGSAVGKSVDKGLIEAVIAVLDGLSESS